MDDRDRRLKRLGLYHLKDKPKELLRAIEQMEKDLQAMRLNEVRDHLVQAARPKPRQSGRTKI
jgi:hypothetical protein